MARRKKEEPLEVRLARAVARWKPLPVGLLLEEALTKINSLEEEIMYEAAGEDI